MMDSEYIKFVENDKNSVSDAIKPILSVGEFFFEAGAQSRQAEIEEITETLKTSADSEKYLFDELQKVKKERDELQKRIDEALGVIYSEKSKVECDVYQGVDADLIIGIGYDLHLILKGKNND